MRIEQVDRNSGEVIRLITVDELERKIGKHESPEFVDDLVSYVLTGGGMGDY